MTEKEMQPAFKAAVSFYGVCKRLPANANLQGLTLYLPVGATVGVVLLAELLFVVFNWLVAPDVAQVRAYPVPAIAQVSNTHALGRILYTDYFFVFQAAGMVLLVAMVGAIVLTLRARVGVRRQRVSQQLARRREQSVEVREVQPGSGV